MHGASATSALVTASSRRDHGLAGFASGRHILHEPRRPALIALGRGLAPKLGVVWYLTADQGPTTTAWRWATWTEARTVQDIWHRSTPISTTFAEESLPAQHSYKQADAHSDRPSEARSDFDSDSEKR